MDLFICEICNKNFDIKKQLQNHKKVHSGVRYGCELCDKIFKTKEGLTKHTTSHTGEKSFTCSTCGKLFADPSSCKSHEKYQHAVIDPSVDCDICSKSFKRMRELKRHKVIHDIPTHPDGSKVKFTNEFKIEALKSVAKIGPTETSNQMKIPYTTLRNWIKACKTTHNFSCQYCGKVFSTQGRLDEHEKLKHSDRKTDFGRGKKFGQSFRQEVAEYAKMFTVKAACSHYNLADSSVRNILRIFKNLFQCKLCERKCAHQSQLQKHMSDVHKEDGPKTKSNSELSLAEYILKDNVQLEDISKGTWKYSHKHVNPENMILFRNSNTVNGMDKHIISYEAKNESAVRKKFGESFEDINLLNSEDLETSKYKEGFNESQNIKVKQEIVNIMELKERKCFIKSIAKKEIENNEDSNIEKENEYLVAEISEKNKHIVEKQNENSVEEKIGKDNENKNLKPFENEIEKILLEECEKNVSDEHKEKTENSIEINVEKPTLNNFEDEKEKIKPAAYDTEKETENKVTVDQSNGDEFEVIMTKMKQMDEKDIRRFMDYLKSAGVKTEFKTSDQIIKKTEIFPTTDLENKHDGNDEILMAMPLTEIHPKDENMEQIICISSENYKEMECSNFDYKNEDAKGNLDNIGHDDKLEENTPTSHLDDEEQDVDNEAESKDVIKAYHNDMVFPISDEKEERNVVIKEETDVLEIHSDFVFNDLALKEIKKKTTWFKCGDCLNIYKYLSDFRRHLANHTTAKDFECSHCKSAFKRKDTLNRHLLLHSEEKAFKCAECPAAYSQRQSLERHAYTNHDESFKGHTCKVCSREFKEKATLTDHLRTHTGEQPYNCHICEKKFAHRSRLKSHIACIHEGKILTRKEKRQICELCSETFISGYGFNQHLKRHQLKEGKLDKEYKCETCDKRFFTKGDIVRHMKTHNGQRDHQCSQCGKTYKDKRNLEKHQEIAHEGRRDHTCNECGKTFTRLNSLNGHMLLHAGGHTLFKCSICSVAYKEKRNLIKHKKRCHK